MLENRAHTSEKLNFGFLAVAVFSVIAAATYTTLAGLLATKFILSGIEWNAASISIGVAINITIYGLFSPFAIALMKAYGIRKISIYALSVLIGGSLLCLIPNLLVFNIVWGLVVGIAIGTFTMSYGALVATMYFPKNVGLVSGVLTACSGPILPHFVEM